MKSVLSFIAGRHSATLQESNWAVCPGKHKTVYTLFPIFLGIIQINQKAVCTKMFTLALFVIHHSFNIQLLTAQHVVGKRGVRNMKMNET